MKIIFLIVAFFACFGAVNAQYNQVPIGSVNTENYAIGWYGTGNGFHWRKSYPDTATANATTPIIKTIAGYEILVGDDIYLRSQDLTKWIKQASGTTTSGTVTNVGALPPLFTTANATTTPTFSLISQSANKFFASPNGSSGVASFRSIVAGDLPAGTGTVTNVGLSVPSVSSPFLGVSGSPVTTSGTLALSALGTIGQYVRGDGSLATTPSIVNEWHTTGNAGTVAGTNFAGTTDNIDYVLKRNSLELFRLREDGAQIGDLANASGVGSIALGFNTTASGAVSTAIGNSSIASGVSSTSTGLSTIASGDNSFTAGNSSISSGETSIALGNNAVASGKHSIALGDVIKSKSYAGFVAGIYNDSTNATDANAYNGLNRAFQIGNGTANNARSNALTILFNGATSFGTSSFGTPGYILQSNGPTASPTWEPLATNNIYNSDGTLTGDRDLSGNGNSLTFEGLSRGVIEARSGLQASAIDLEPSSLSLTTSSASHQTGITAYADSISILPSLGIINIDTVRAATIENTLLGWRQGTSQGRTGYVTMGTGISLSAGVLSATGSGGTVTSVATNTGSGITGGTITATGTIAADTTNVLATKYYASHQTPPLNTITAAVATNSINNANFGQTWAWNSLATQTALNLSSTSITSGSVLKVEETSTTVSNNGAPFRVNASGANFNSNRLTIGQITTNTHTGTGSTNIAGKFSASGGANNYALWIDDGLQAAGKVLTSDVNGLASWQTPSAGTPSLTATQIAFGDGSNLMTSSSDLTWDNSAKLYNINGDLTVIGSTVGAGMTTDPNFVGGRVTSLGDWNDIGNSTKILINDNNGVKQISTVADIHYFANQTNTTLVGINRSMPTVALDVVGDIRVTGANTLIQSDDPNSVVSLIGNILNNIIIDGSNGEVDYMAGSGGHNFVSGTVQINDLSGTGTRAVLADASGVLSAPISDARKKKNFKTVANYVDVIGMLRNPNIHGIFYNWIDSSRGKAQEIGFTAQMFENVQGLTGTMTKTGDKYLNYERISALLWEQNRLQQVVIDNQEARLRKLEEQNKQILKQFAAKGTPKKIIIKYPKR